MAFLHDDPVQPKEREMISEGDAWDRGVAFKRIARRLLKIIQKNRGRLRKEKIPR